MGALKRGLTLQWKSDATIPATFWEIRRKLSVRRTVRDKSVQMFCDVGMFLQ